MTFSHRPFHINLFVGFLPFLTFFQFALWSYHKKKGFPTVLQFIGVLISIDSLILKYLKAIPKDLKTIPCTYIFPHWDELFGEEKVLRYNRTFSSLIPNIHKMSLHITPSAHGRKISYQYHFWDGKILTFHNAFIHSLYSFLSM